MLSTISAILHEKQVDTLVDSWFTQSPSVSREDVDALEIELAEGVDSASSDTTEDQPE